MHSFTFNGHSSDEFGIRIERFPDLNRSERKYKSASVAGRNGNIYQMQNAWEEVTVSYQIFAGERQAGAAVSDFTEIVEWLNSADDYAVLMDTYDPEHYRLAVFVDELEIESQWHTFGKATVRFRCRPQRFIKYAGQNGLPKLPEGSQTNAGITIVVDADGVATMSGTSTRVTSFDFDVANPLTFTTDMVGMAIEFNNSAVDATFGLYENVSQGAWTPIVYNIPLNEENKTIYVTQEMVGRTLDRYSIRFPSGVTASGTFKPSMLSSVIDVESGDTITNNTNHIAKPIITLTGDSTEHVKSMLDLETPYAVSNYNASQNWYAQWMNNIFFASAAVRTMWDGTYMVIDTWSSSATSGTLTTHVNSTGTITFTPFRTSMPVNDVGIGRGITLAPDTDYTISCTTTSGSSKIWVGFFDIAGKKPYNSSAEASRSGAGALSLTFHVPPTCSNTLIIFYRTDNTAGSFSSIMLSTGTSVLPFYPYGNTTIETVTINDTVLRFTTSGFDTAVIDCEKEDITVDGVNANSLVEVYDQYSNLSVDYLQLKTGTNTVNYTSGIESMTIEPRFWEL